MELDLRERLTPRAVAIIIAAVAGVAVFYVATSLFPYHSTNHDEGVYLQQASMLLDGQLRMWTPAPELTDSFRPWFFVVEGNEMYPKYTPVPAAVFALGKLLGGFRVALGVVAFANAFLVYLVVREGFDETVGVVASALLVLSPFFLVNSSLFLPYATTTVFNLVFALGYVRSFCGPGSADLRYAALAGVGVGISFFSRPYTAVLFASPFVAHAVYTLYSSLRGGDGTARCLVGYSVVSSLGLAFVGLTLAYNDFMTGSPLTFPYLEFAPRDGLGFGERAILEYDRTYTPRLGLRANAHALWHLASDWTTAGLLGSVVAVVGGGLALIGDGNEDGRERQVRLLLLGVFVSFVVGNVYFWGTLNILGEIGDPTDGLITLYGPYYHYDTLLPISAFMSFGIVSVYRRLSSGFAEHRRAVLVVALVLGLVFAGAAAAEVNEKVERNAETTDAYERAYQPFEETDLGNALVLLPTPYGDWLNHPFQYLRNPPDLDGGVVYALDRGPENFGVVDAYPNRTYYRYSYRGEWEPYADEAVEPDLDRVEVVEGETVEATTVVETENVSTASVSLGSGEGSVYYSESPDGELVVRILVDGVNRTAHLRSRPDSRVSLEEKDEISVTVHVTRGYLDEVTYRQRFSVETTGGEVRVISPETEYCPVVTGCQGETAYVSDERVSTRIEPVTSGAPEEGP